MFRNSELTTASFAFFIMKLVPEKWTEEDAAYKLDDNFHASNFVGYFWERKDNKLWLKSALPAGQCFRCRGSFSLLSY